jgi:hypothetical protein
LILPAPRTRRAAHFLKEHSGTWTWPKYGYSFSYTFTPAGHSACLKLWGRQAIELEATSPNYGGVRWWYLCPRCTRRASRLYLPNRERFFLCRICHDLSYESAQSSRAGYYQLFKDSARQLPKGYCTATYFREAIRAGIGGFQVADVVGQAEAFN